RLFFFFSSRRRHTRSKRDWSSDVCSSDLGPGSSPFCRCCFSESGFAGESEPAAGKRGTGAGNRPRKERLEDTFLTLLFLEAKIRSEERRVGKEWRSQWCK